MADESAKLDTNGKWIAMGVTNDSNLYLTMLRVDPTTKRLLVDASVSLTINAEHVEDAAAADGATGDLILGVRQDADTSPVSADGDYHYFVFDNAGAAKVNVKTSALPTGAATAARQDTGNTSLSSIDGKFPAASAMGDGDTNPTAPYVKAANGVFNGSTWDRLLEAANALNSTGTGIPTAQLIGQFDDTSPTAITENRFGNLRISSNRNLYSTIRDAAGNERGANVDANFNLGVVLPSETTKVIGTIRNVGNVGGIFDAVTGASVPANALYKGSQAITSLPTAVSNAQIVGTAADKYGRQVALLGTIRDLVGTQTTTISASTAETTIVTAAASIFNDLVMLIVSNTSTGTNTRIDFRDTTAGSVLFSLQSNGGQPPVGFSLGGASIPQTTVNTNWTAQCATSTTDIRVYAVYHKNK